MIIQIIFIIMIIILIYYFQKISRLEVTISKSDLDNREYLVQNLEDKNEATYILSIIRDNIFTIRDYLNENINKYPDYIPYIKQLSQRINNLVLQENSPNGKYTSYTVNKGEEMILCLRSKETGKFHDINLIMYVVIHELAHVACPEKGHTELFKNIFIFLLKVATEIKIYQKVNYRTDPQEYCGIIINENLLKEK